MAEKNILGEGVFTADALDIHKRFPGFQAINWIGAEGGDKARFGITFPTEPSHQVSRSLNLL
jgi:hypothetical protein